MNYGDDAPRGLEELSMVNFGLILDSRVPPTLYKSEWFYPPYDAGVKILLEKGSTTEDVAKVVNPAYINDAHEAVCKWNGIGESFNWAKALQTAYENFVRGDKFVKLGKKLKNNENVDILPLYGELSSAIANEGSGLKAASEIDYKTYKPFMPCGYKPIDETLGGIPSDGPIIIYGVTGVGKCFAKGTKVLMYDGTCKNIEDVEMGDLVMGPDSEPRRVLGLGNGMAEMYKVTPTKGEPYIVNDEHILSLRITNGNPMPEFDDGQIVNISVKDYLQMPNRFKHVAKGWRTGIIFSHHIPSVEPRFLGIWLGDGNTNDVGITTGDKEIVDYLYDYAERIGMRVYETAIKQNHGRYYISNEGRGGGNRVSLQGMLRSIGVLENKHIPQEYKNNSVQVRLNLLAGLIDTDGSYSHNCYDYVSKSKTLAEDVVWLARSLGLAAYMKPTQKMCYNNGKIGLYYRVTISGDIYIIPVLIPHKKAHPRLQKKNVLNVGIKVESVGYGEYFGFELDRDGLFLLSDFTVTHNSKFATAIVNGLLHKYPEKRGAIYTLEMNEKHWLWRTVNLFPDIQEVLPRLHVSGQVRDMEELVAEVTAGKFDFVVLDDMDNMVKSSEASEYERIYRRVKEVCRFMSIPFFVLGQPNREAKFATKSHLGKDGKRIGGRFLGKYDVAWSGAAENSAALQIALQTTDGFEVSDESFPTTDDLMDYVIFWKSRDGWPGDYDPTKAIGPGAIVMNHSPNWIGKPHGKKGWKLWTVDSGKQKIGR